MAASLVFKLTGTTGAGGAGHSSAASSLGGLMAATPVSSTALNNLWDNVSPTEATDGDTEYRAIDIYNSGNATARSVELWFSTVSNHASVSVTMGYLASVGATAGQNHLVGSNLELLASESSTPACPCTFTLAQSGSKISLSDISSGKACRVYLRRVVSANARNLANNTIQISVQYA